MPRLQLSDKCSAKYTARLTWSLIHTMGMAVSGGRSYSCLRRSPGCRMYILFVLSSHLWRAPRLWSVTPLRQFSAEYADNHRHLLARLLSRILEFVPANCSCISFNSLHKRWLEKEGVGRRRKKKERVPRSPLWLFISPLCRNVELWWNNRSRNSSLLQSASFNLLEDDANLVRPKNILSAVAAL